MWSMDFKSLIDALTRSGLTQQEIGEFVGLSQPSVSDIATGKTKQVSFDVGNKIVELHQIRCCAA